MAYKKLAHFSPGRAILLALFLTILIGAFCLSLPIARNASINFLDLLFTATSATCVTGLFTIPLEHFTPVGHAIILLLIQIGGLGIITMTLFIMSLVFELGFTTQLMAGQLLELDSWKHIRNIFVFIIAFTVSVELLGAGLIYLAIRSDFAPAKAIFFAVFHSITSFCNAGITLFPHGITPYSTNYIFLITTMVLVLCGGLGFITWRELFQNLHLRLHDKRTVYSLQTKLILSGTVIMIGVLTVLFWILEHDNAFNFLSTPLSLMNALFSAITLRSAGFLTVAVNTLHPATLFIITLSSIIGSAPGGTGSGIKITTFIILLATIKAGIAAKYDVEIKGRRIARDQLHKAITIALLSIFWIALIIFFLLITEQHATYIEIIFETISAFTNLGITTGITPYLSSAGKLFILLSMIIGRIGSLTLLMALLKAKKDMTGLSYPEERIMLG